ncbi:MAG: methylmalonyl-CoA mutase family protein [Candidatus Krumholzibacteriia bacterium]
MDGDPRRGTAGDGDPGEPRERLLAGFAAASLDDWYDEVVRQLAGVPFEKAMLTPTDEGVTLRPIYTRSDLDDLPWTASCPGEYPFLRGMRPLDHRRGSWDVVQDLLFPLAEDLNLVLRHDLERGQDAVALVLDAASRSGRDPDHAEPGGVGRDGLSVAVVADLARALDGISLEEHPVYLDAGVVALPATALLLALVEGRGEDPRRLRGCVGADPVALLAMRGTLPVRTDRLYREVAALTRWARTSAPDLRTVAAWGYPYHEAGGNAAQELAFTLAAAVEHLRALEREGLPPGEVIPHLQLGFGVGTHFFMEIAKLRAARVLWAQVVRSCGGDDDLARRTRVHARTSSFTKTVYDRHVNILRTTTEAMAAVLGGVDSLTVLPFDAPLGLPSELARRLARNTHTILREESHLAAVVDPAGGSWYVERLTADLGDLAWSIFQEIEGDGGMMAALASGEIQGRIAAVADERARKAALRRSVIVGTNQYPDATEKTPAPNVPHYRSLHRQRAAAMQGLRGAAGRDRSQELERVEEMLRAEPAQLLPALAAAAGRGTTLGELTSALRSDVRPGPQVAPLRPCRAAEPFERLRRAVLARAAEEPDAVRVHLCCLGDVARYTPRLDFTRAFFQVGGFRVEERGWFDTPTEAAAAARRGGAPRVVIVGRDETYQELAVATAEKLKRDGGPRTVILAGYPKDLVPQLEAAGVDRFIHAQSDALAVLDELAAESGVQS